MLAYVKTYQNFTRDITRGVIVNEIEKQSGRKYSRGEERAFSNSLGALKNALETVALPPDAQVGIEIKVPLTNRRIDFVIAGEDDECNKNVVIVELKQWEEVQHTDMDDIVLVGRRQHVHPSWQAYSYGSTFANFNEYVENNSVNIRTCTFLHNYKTAYEGEIKNEIYEEGLRLAPAFLEDGWEEFARFVERSIKKASSADLLYYLEEGRIKPSRYLVECVANLLEENKDLELIDNQRIAYSNLLSEIKKTKQTEMRKVFIVRGGAGTGKSLIALQLLGELHKEGMTAFYVAKSSYIKESYFKQLTRGIPNYKMLRTLFRGSGEFYKDGSNAPKQFDCLLVDEAHRLTEKTKQSFMFYGNNQIQEIIHAARVTVFFLDETQQIDIKDYGTAEHIREAADLENAVVIEDDRFRLYSQFRCNGSDEYIAWVESLLYNQPYERGKDIVDYDIRLFDDIRELHQMIRQKNAESSHPSRMLSGDVFPWVSRDDPDAIDIQIGDYRAQWNRTKSFAVDPKSIDEVGCIHTSQGMEFEYAGLIIGDDLLYRNGKVITDYTRHPKKAGEFKRPQQRTPRPEDEGMIDRIIRNTYKVLFTRGQKGLYLYVMDPELKEYIKQRIRLLRYAEALGQRPGTVLL